MCIYSIVFMYMVKARVEWQVHTSDSGYEFD